jgi:cytochrome d ubiquinol oxidase subunit I
MIKFSRLGPSSLHTGKYHFEKLEAQQAQAGEAQS